MRTILRLLPLLAAAALALPAVAAASVTHTVRRGETLSSIAATDGLSVSALAAANGMAPTSVLATGRPVVIPPRGSVGDAPSGAAPQSAAPPAAASQSVESESAEAPSAPAPTASPAASAGAVQVTPGDTLSALAARYGTSVDALAAANGMNPNGLLLAGRTLSIPGQAAAQPAPSAPATTVESAPASSAPSATAGAQMVSPSQVGSIATENGVSPSLAEAVAQQESGFNNAEVSRTGATGVMQIEPSTWRQINGAGGPALATSSPTDNIRGGVTLLHGLLAQTGGNESEALAGYYQGLNSVRAQGMYPSTRRYVRNVLALQGRY